MLNKLLRIMERVLIFLSRWIWRAFFFFVILLAVFISIGREMLPLLEKNKSWLEGRLSAGASYRVQMEAIQAQWEGLIPELRVTGLSVGDHIHVEQASLRVDLLRSAWHRSIVFDGLLINGAKISVEVDENALNSTDPANQKIQMDRALSFLFGSANIQLQDIEVILNRVGRMPLPIQINKLEVGNYGNEHWMDGDVLVAQASKPIEFRGEFRGSAKQALAGNGQLYLDFGDGSRIRHILAFLMDSSSAPIQIEEQSRLYGQAWLNWNQNNLQWNAVVDVKNIFIPTLDYRVDYSGSLGGTYRIQDGIIDSLTGVSLHEAFAYSAAGKISINNKSFDVPGWGFRYRSNEQEYDNEPALALYIPELDLFSLEQYRSLIAYTGLRDTLTQLHPKGNIYNAWLTMPIKKDSTFQALIRMNLNQVSVAAWRGVPALTQVDGYLESTIKQGFVDVNSQKGFSMKFPFLYDHAMEYHSAEGRVSWGIDEDELFVGSENLFLRGEDGTGRAAFWLELPSKSAHRDSQFYLSVGLTNTESQYRNKYLPKTLPRSLRDWLDASIQQGSASDNGFVYRGSLSSHKKSDSTILYYGNLADTILKFDPNWPELSKVSGQLLVDNDNIHADIYKAELNGLALGKMQVDVASGKFITIQSDLVGLGNDALDMLRKTPIRDTVGEVFDQWSLHNPISIRLSLGISLEKSKKNEFQEVVTTLKNNQLEFSDLNITLDKLNGDIYYSSKLGITAPKMTAYLWGKPITLAMEPINDKDGLPDILLTMNGDVPADELTNWSQLALLNFIKGNIPVQGKMEIPMDEHKPLDSSSPPVAIATLAFFSDLKDIALELPPPFGKKVDEQLPIAMSMNLYKDEQQYTVRFGNAVSGKINVQDGAVKSGLMSINEELPEEKLNSGLLIQGHLQQAAVSEWLPVIEQYERYEKALNKKSNKVRGDLSKPSTSPQFKLYFDELMLGDLPLKDIKLEISQQQVVQENRVASSNFWNINFDHPAAHGNYRYFDKKGKLPELFVDSVNLDTWKVLNNPIEKMGATTNLEDTSSEEITLEEKVDANAVEVEKKDPMADVVPQELPAMLVSIKQVILDGMDLGAWSFELKPQKWGASFENLNMTMPGLVIGGTKENEGARALWRKKGDVMSTQINSLMRISKGGSVNQLFGTEKIIEAESSELQGSLTWDGSPAHIQFKNMTGEVSLKSKNGRFLNSNATTDFMRVINVFNFNTWARRLQLDFSDLYKKGVSYDKVSGHVALNRGKVIFDKPLVMESPSSRFVLQGIIDSPNNKIDADLIVTLPVSDNATWITALAGGLPAAAGVWIVSKIFKKQIDSASSVSYTVSGDLDDPKVEFKKLAGASASNPQVEKN